MATPTFDLLDEVTLPASASYIELAGLGSLTGYRDLYITLEGKTVTSTYYAYILTIPNPSAYNYTWASGASGSVQGGGGSDNKIQFEGRSSYWGSTDIGYSTIQVFDFQKTDRYKNMIIETGHPGYSTENMFATAQTTSALTAIRFYMNVGSWAAGTRAKIWGIAA